MSVPWRSRIARRPFLLGAFAVLAGIAGTGVLLETPTVRRTRAVFFHGNLLGLLDDRGDARLVGASVLKGLKSFDVRQVTGQLQDRIGKQALSHVLTEDAAAGRLTDAGGWVLPETLALLCALAARTR
jgi:hypothetical protein